MESLAARAAGRVSRQRLTTAAVVVVACAGALTLLVRAHSGTHRVVRATAPSTALPAQLGSPSDIPSRLLSRETVDGVRIRLFQNATPGLDSVSAELSTDQAIGRMAGVALGNQSGPLQSTSLAVFGSDKDLAVAVTVKTRSDVSLVRVRFDDGGTDAVHPVHGWAVLARHRLVLAGTLEAHSASGTLLGSVELPAPTTREVAPTVFRRVTPDDVLIIGRRSAGFFAPGVAVPGASEPQLEGIPWCELTGRHLVVGGADLLGAMEGDPVTVVPVHAGPDIALVRIRFADGTVDQMVPFQGQALLARRGTVQIGRVEALDGTGHVVASSPVTPVAAAQSRCS